MRRMHDAHMQWILHETSKRKEEEEKMLPCWQKQRIETTLLVSQCGMLQLLLTTTGDF